MYSSAIYHAVYRVPPMGFTPSLTLVNAQNLFSGGQAETGFKWCDTLGVRCGFVLGLRLTVAGVMPVSDFWCTGFTSCCTRFIYLAAGGADMTAAGAGTCCHVLTHHHIADDDVQSLWYPVLTSDGSYLEQEAMLLRKPQVSVIRILIINTWIVLAFPCSIKGSVHFHLPEINQTKIEKKRKKQQKTPQLSNRLCTVQPSKLHFPFSFT